RRLCRAASPPPWRGCVAALPAKLLITGTFLWTGTCHAMCGCGNHCPQGPASLNYGFNAPRATRTSPMKRRRVIYEGKAKILYEGTEPGTVIQYSKDDATAGNGAKKDTIEGKGVLNNRISEYLMTQLQGIGVPTHFVRRLNMREQLIKEV